MDEQTVLLGDYNDFGEVEVALIEVGDKLAALGYAVVKLPRPVVDEWGTKSWPFADGKHSGVRLDDDGRLSLVGVSNPVSTAEQALSLAAALIAAAQHVMEKE